MRLTIARDGRVTNATLVTASMAGILDAACLGMSHDTLPPLPRDWPRDDATITLEMRLDEIPGPETLPWLRWLRQQGYF